MSKQQGFSPAKEVAEKNRDDFDRKWNFPSDRGKWEFEVKKGSEMTFELDDDGVYPTDKALEDISNFSLKVKTGREFLDLIKPIWNYADAGYWHIETEQKGDYMIYQYHLSTVGWSGNEDIIRALQKNVLFWHMYWYSSRRGGHYIFEFKERIV